MSDPEKEVENEAEQDAEGDVKRTNWSNPFEFILTCVGFAVGLGNVWRFPYLCYKNGGGAFLIPYTICLLLIGMPLFFLEINFGQFSSLGPLKVWAINPAMRGIGIAMVIIPGLVSLYYSVVIAYCFYYLFASMRAHVPWHDCRGEWNSCSCRTMNMNLSLEDPWNGTRAKCINYTETLNITSPTHEYFYNKLLNMSEGVGDIGVIKWDVMLCNLLVWVIVWLVLSKGVKSLGKVMYFTTIFPYVMLTVLLVKGVTMEGYYRGIYFYLKPDFSRLANANVWGDAATQTFFSLSTGMGGLIALGSYNKFHHHTLRDALLVPVINWCTSIYAGLAIFSVLGHMAFAQQKPVSEVAIGGPGLIFEVYPEGLAEMPFPPIWSFLFFFMMASLGLSSQFAFVEAFMTSIEDYCPKLLNKRYKKIIFRGTLALLGFLLGLTMVTEGGFYFVNLIDVQLSGFPLLVIGLCEVATIAYIYGLQNFVSDIEMMLGKSLFTRISLIYFKACWTVLTPLVLTATIIFKIYQYRPLTLGEYTYPKWAQALAWGLTFFPIIFIPIWLFGWSIKKGLCQFCREINNPTSSWRPAKAKNREGTKYERNEGLLDIPSNDFQVSIPNGASKGTKL